MHVQIQHSHLECCLSVTLICTERFIHEHASKICFRQVIRNSPMTMPCTSHIHENRCAFTLSSAGMKDIDAIVERFMEAEDANFSLFNYVNEVNAEVEKLEEQIAEIKVRIVQSILKPMKQAVVNHTLTFETMIGLLVLPAIIILRITQTRSKVVHSSQSDSQA